MSYKYKSNCKKCGRKSNIDLIVGLLNPRFSHHDEDINLCLCASCHGRLYNKYVRIIKYEFNDKSMAWDNYVRWVQGCLRNEKIMEILEPFPSGNKDKNIKVAFFK